MIGERTLLEARVSELLDAVATPEPIPGAGSVAGIAVSMAAAICSMAARASEDWSDAKGVAAQADALRARTIRLAELNAHAYGEALTAFRLPSELDPDVRDATLGKALARAVDLPLALAEAAADVAELGALIAHEGQPAMRGDAAAASVLAAAGARAATMLVAVNLGVRPDDRRLLLARRLTDTAARAAGRAERTIVKDAGGPTA